MIQYYLDLEQQVKSIQEKRLSLGQIQKIYSTAWYISLSIRSPGKTWHVYLGRGSGYEGLWVHEAAPPKELRRKDTFLEYLRRHLSACSFLGVELDPFDRIVKLSYQKYGQEQALLLFWKGRKLYFLHYYKDSPESPTKILLSWRGKSYNAPEGQQSLFGYFDELGRHQDKIHELATPVITPMEGLLEDELKASELKGLSSRPTFLQRKKENIEDDLRRSRQWEKLQKILDVGQNLEGMYELKVADQKVKFEGELNPFERRNLVFQKIKKLKRGEGILSQRLQNVDELLEGKTSPPKAVSTIPINRPVWGEEKALAKSISKTTSDEFNVFKMENCQIAVGHHSQGNDQLRSKWASKDDYWLHLDGLKSAHVIIKPLNQAVPTTEMINIGASIVAHFSHFNDDWIPIIYTQVKNLKGVTGAAGMVTFKKEKHLRCQKVKIDHLLEGTT